MVAFMAFIGSPLGKIAGWIALGAVIVAGGLYFLHTVKESGRVEERAAEAAVAGQHARTVLKNARDVDADVAREPDPQAVLKKNWERPDDR